MNIDLTGTFERALAKRLTWSRERLLSLANSFLKQVVGASLDWDEEAGEAWARIIVSKAPIAAIWTQAPLAFLSVHADVDRGALDTQVEWIAYNGWEEPVFCIDKNKTPQFFGAGRWVDDINPELFSLNDIWWTTV